tara:strand:- start:18 stop:1265 length:1248 start_codon:yes stop_codon:yes gene_type:complete
MKNRIINLAENTRKDFPLIDKNNENIIYLDHAATSQKPESVLNTLSHYYENYNANVHRGAHSLSAKATENFENSRKIISQFINAYSPDEIVFTRNATEAINLIARSWTDNFLNKDDEIILSIMEHHSNIVPWQMAAKRIGFKIQYVRINKEGGFDIDDFQNKLNEKTKIVSIVHISNTLGCCNPINAITELSHKKGALVFLDACQSLAHRKINIKELNIDLLAGSGHKMCGPTGIGFLWARKEILQATPPFLGGGEMINEVSLQSSSWSELPHKFEAGTPAIGEAIGLGAAIKYLEKIGLNNIEQYETELINYLFEKLSSINNIRILGPKPIQDKGRGALATFVIDNIHSNDIAEILDTQGICIRSGHHCCQPLHEFFSIKSSARASLNFTNSFNEIDNFIQALKDAIVFLDKYS